METDPFSGAELSPFLVEALKHFEASMNWFSPKMCIVGGYATPTAREIVVATKLRDASRVRCSTCETEIHPNHTVHDYISYDAQCPCIQTPDTMAYAFQATTVRIIEVSKELGLLPKSVQAITSTPNSR